MEFEGKIFRHSKPSSATRLNYLPHQIETRIFAEICKLPNTNHLQFYP